MEVNQVSNVTRNKTDNGTPIVMPGKETDKDVFLQMLVGQMTNQDPFNPQDPTQYITQLAQFSSLEQMMSMNDAMENLLGLNSGVLINSAVETASSLIGKNVELETLDEAGKKVTYSGVVKGAVIKEGTVYLEVKLHDSDEVKQIPYSSLVKVKEGNEVQG